MTHRDWDRLLFWTMALYVAAVVGVCLWVFHVAISAAPQISKFDFERRD